MTCSSGISYIYGLLFLPSIRVLLVWLEGVTCKGLVSASNSDQEYVERMTVLTDRAVLVLAVAAVTCGIVGVRLGGVPSRAVLVLPVTAVPCIPPGKLATLLKF